MSRVQPARRVAAEVLAAVRESDAYANLLLPARLREAGLTGTDAALATELAYGTLRMRGYYDRVIELASRRPVARLDGPVLDALRLGAHQLLGMRVPAYAVIDESVELVRRARHASATGFVNGVLRTLSRSTPETWRERALNALTGVERLAVEFSHPEWIVEALRAALDAEGAAAELPQLLAADNAAPRPALVALPGLADPGALTADGSLVPGRVSPLALHQAAGGDPTRLPEVAAGRVRVQDEGSQLAALALSRARGVEPGERWLDLCAGPGGKAALLAAAARLGGARLTANEVLPARAGLVRDALRALGDGPDAPRVVEGDGRRFPEGELFDRILLDAPCTGLGALRRRPEARWRRTPEDLAALLPLQAELLDAAVAALAPRGVLAYVTCSPHPAETREQVAAALERHPGLRALDTPAVLETLARVPLGLPVGPAAQLWPHRHGTDAMFVQLLSRVSG